MNKQNIYQVFCGRYSEINISDHEGEVFKRMQGINWGQILDNGFEYIYLLGVFNNLGPIVVNIELGSDISQQENRIPSSFAITNHKQVNPKMGTEEDFIGLVEAIHVAGGKVLIDFVPNHTGLDHQWIEKHPEYYKQTEMGVKTAFCGDVAELNYQNEALKQEMRGVMQHLVKWDIDGVRADMAHLVPVDFWEPAIDGVKQNKNDFKFVAEAYSDSVFDWEPLTQLLDAGFDMVYHEFLYRNLRQIFQQNQPLTQLVEHLNYTSSQDYAEKLTHYLSNHDDVVLPELKQFYKGLSILLDLLPGNLLVFNGQFNKPEGRLAHHWMEALPLKDTEFENVPIWWSNWKQLNLALDVKMIETELVEEEGLIIVKLKVNNKPGVFIINLSHEQAQLPDKLKLLGAGLLNQLGTNEQIHPGLYDLYMLSDN